ncbi:MAG: hypothetical protein PF570_05310 [Candidatus Cloacimonetes bacterium]|jgi:hypothetical protein|nr:hypothetical protein [Candidatus Cloacimonadota bacterium]
MKKIIYIVVMLLVLCSVYANNFKEIEKENLRSIYKKTKKYKEANEEDLRHSYRGYIKEWLNQYIGIYYRSPRHEDYSSILVQPLRGGGYVIVIRHKFSYRAFGGGRTNCDKVYTYRWDKPDNIDLNVWLPMHSVNYSKWKKSIGKIEFPDQ